MKRVFLNIIIVVVVVFALDFVIGKALRHYYFTEFSGRDARTTYAMEKTKAEVLIFGASRANHHYVPEAFEKGLGKSFYNTGIEGNSIFYQLAVLRAVLKRYTPDLIVLEAGDFGKDIDSYDRLSVLLPYYERHEEIRDIVNLRGPYEKYKLISHIYPFNSRILSIIAGNMSFNKKRRPDIEGYIPLSGKWTEPLDSMANVAYPIDTNKVAAFKEFLDLSKENGVEVVVVFSPIYLKNAHQQDIKMTKQLCAEHDVRFYDYSADTTFLNNPSLFKKEAYLNHKGAVLFSEMLVKRIKDDFKEF